MSEVKRPNVVILNIGTPGMLLNQSDQWTHSFHIEVWWFVNEYVYL